MTPDRILNIEQLARQYGSSNGWTGTCGTLSAVIMELLGELKDCEQRCNGLEARCGECVRKEGDE